MKKKLYLLRLIKRCRACNTKTSIYHIVLVILSLFCLYLSGCSNGNKLNELPKGIEKFFGDSLTILNSSNTPNGYKVSMLYNKDICIFHFERGDSIDKFLALSELPNKLKSYKDLHKAQSIKMNIPILQLDTIGGSKETPDMFFMDVNFDGEEEFIVKNRKNSIYSYDCFDLLNGNSTDSNFGLLEPIQEEPYNNIVSFDRREPSYTVFDYKKRTIYIHESSGCCSYYEIWAKSFNDPYLNRPNIKVVKQVEHEWWNGSMHINVIK